MQEETVYSSTEAATTIFGFEQKTIIVFLLIAVLFLLILTMISIHKLNIISRKYGMIMSGKKGADLERVIFTRFKEMDRVKQNARRITKDVKRINKRLENAMCKYAVVKYDAFDEMAGKLSFVIALLNEKNTGFVLNSMHSREGCHTYAKEIINGESYIPLSDEEKQALQEARTVEEEIKDIANEEEDKDLAELADLQLSDLY